MEVRLKDGTIITVDMVMERFSEYDKRDSKDGVTLELCLPEEGPGLSELSELFTPERCSRIACVTDFGEKAYTGYEKVLGISDTVEQAMSRKVVKLGIPIVKE